MFGFDSLAKKEMTLFVAFISQASMGPVIVTKERYEDLHEILFYNKTKIPILLNTSYNLHGFPIVENSFQAIDVFLQTELDILIINSTAIWKKKDIL